MIQPSAICIPNRQDVFVAEVSWLAFMEQHRRMHGRKQGRPFERSLAPACKEKVSPAKRRKQARVKLTIQHA
eukprot:1140631-Pelagomonas_calceolata.AAC.8